MVIYNLYTDPDSDRADRRMFLIFLAAEAASILGIYGICRTATTQRVTQDTCAANDTLRRPTSCLNRRNLATTPVNSR